MSNKGESEDLDLIEPKKQTKTKTKSHKTKQKQWSILLETKRSLPIFLSGVATGKVPVLL